MSTPRTLRMGEAVPLAEIPRLDTAGFRARVTDVAWRLRLVALFGRPSYALTASEGRPSSSSVAAEGQSAVEPGAPVTLTAIFADDRNGQMQAFSTDVGASYPALTPDCPQANGFEREIAEQWGVRPEGHPWLKPLRYHRSAVPGRDAWGRAPGTAIEPSVTDFFRVEGEAVHEVAVGPVHAGVIEPGHFRFQCFGETVLHLEIALGYQHRGVEQALRHGDARRVMPYMETLAGDTTIGHATAYAQALESAAGARVSARAHALRAVALELERLANHTGDLGALAGDVAFLPTMSYCGRIRGDFLNMTALICGNRFGRGLVRPGGVRWDLDPARKDELLSRLAAAEADTKSAVELMFDSPSVLARFEETGTVSFDECESLGLVGPAARACGAERDVRQDFPGGMYRFQQIPVGTWSTGDVFGRAFVRWLEIQRSIAFIREVLQTLPEGDVLAPCGPLAPDSLVVSLVEGWRGEVAHVLITGAQGQREFYKIVDPSFHNWMGLAIAMRDQAISDFPICNKSFNLSYCGHDL